MRARVGVLRDGALLLLAVLIVAATAFVLTSSPGPAPASSDRVLPPVSPRPDPVPTAQPVRVLFLGSDALLGPTSLGAATARALGWEAVVDAAAGTGYVTGAAGRTYPDRLLAAVRRAAPDVVVVVSSAAAAEEVDGRRFGGNAQFVVGSLRRSLPEADIVLVGPVTATADAFPLQRQVLTQVAARFGAVFVDPTGRGYLTGRADAVNADGSLTAGAVQRVAEQLAADLRRVLPATLLPSPAPSA